MKTWKRVKKSSPCPICGKPDWCGVSSDATLVCCMRVESNRTARNGGWLHTVGNRPQDEPRVYAPKKRKQADHQPFIDWHLVMSRIYATGKRPLSDLAENLGVSQINLCSLGAAWSQTHKAWAFPMYDESSNVIGVRLRNDDGRKWAILGSRAGLFIPPDLEMRTSNHYLICEGPTDTAAMLDLGFKSIGRHSCTGGVDMIISIFANKVRRRDVVIIADRDSSGVSGAERLADAIVAYTRSTVVIYPLQGKDARAWLNAGVTRNVVDTVIRSARYWQRKDAS